MVMEKEKETVCNKYDCKIRFDGLISCSLRQNLQSVLSSTMPYSFVLSKE